MPEVSIGRRSDGGYYLSLSDGQYVRRINFQNPARLKLLINVVHEHHDDLARQIDKLAPARDKAAKAGKSDKATKDEILKALRELLRE